MHFVRFHKILYLFYYDDDTATYFYHTKTFVKTAFYLVEIYEYIYTPLEIHIELIMQ